MRGLDGTVASIAGDQHGNATRRQLVAAGISERVIDERLSKGSLIRVYPGVYRVGHAAPNMEADYMAAVLACGEGAVLSGRAAARLLRLIRASVYPEPEVTTPKGRRIAGITTHRQRTGLARDRMIWKGIPVTKPARTLVDLADAVSAAGLARAVHQAAVLHQTEPAHVEDVLQRRPNAKGAATLRKVLWGEDERILSKLEKAFIRLLKANDLPLPETNRRAGGRFVDCRWPAHRLTVELDSYRYHRSRH